MYIIGETHTVERSRKIARIANVLGIDLSQMYKKEYFEAVKIVFVTPDVVSKRSIHDLNHAKKDNKVLIPLTEEWINDCSEKK